MFLIVILLTFTLILVFYIVFYSFLLSNSIDKKTKNYCYDVSTIENFHYKKKNYVNDFDSEFATKLSLIANKLKVRIVPNVKLSEVVCKTEYGETDELNVIISFGIFSSDFKNTLLLINLSNNDVVRSICKKARIGYMEVKTSSSTDLKHIESRVSKALSK